MSVVKFVDYEFELIPPIDKEEDMVRKIEYAYRICYNSIDKMENEPYEKSIQFIQKNMIRNHLSPLEHVNISIKGVIDRGILAEWTRHRIASYSVESTRYIKYDGEIECIMPHYLRKSDAGKEREIFIESVNKSCESYQQLLKQNVSPQIARSVLPMCLKTSLVATHNLREWSHIFGLRYFGLTGAPHPDFVLAMDKLYKLFHSYYPNIFVTEPINT